MFRASSFDSQFSCVFKVLNKLYFKLLKRSLLEGFSGKTNNFMTYVYYTVIHI
jgi:hypothetical protein